MVLIVLVAHIGFAQGRGLGLGVMIGEPTGISCKGWLSHSGAIQLGVGWPSLSETQGTVVSAEYIWHSHIFSSREYLPLFYGLGGLFGVSSGSDRMAARGIFGIAWWPHHSSLDIFLQLAPALYFKPSSRFDFDFGFGIRYFF